MKPGKHQRSKQRCQDLFWPYTLCMSYVSFYWLVPQYRVNNCFFFVHGQDQKSEQKPTTKNFVGFHNNSALLTMIERPKMFRKKKSTVTY